MFSQKHNSSLKLIILIRRQNMKVVVNFQRIFHARSTKESEIKHSRERKKKKNYCLLSN